jgi:transcriptional regulator with GAF, ATPase, and Fis domain
LRRNRTAEICARASLSELAQPSTIHRHQLRCAPVELIENELFGHEAGAFTGANGAASGLIERANGGTLFLDEVDSLPLSAQVKLLRFLQDKHYRRLGSTKDQVADVRLLQPLTPISLRLCIRALPAGSFTD